MGVYRLYDIRSLDVLIYVKHTETSSLNVAQMYIIPPVFIHFKLSETSLSLCIYSCIYTSAAYLLSKSKTEYLLTIRPPFPMCTTLRY